MIALLIVILLVFVARLLVALGDWLQGMYERGGPWRPWP